MSDYKRSKNVISNQQKPCVLIIGPGKAQIGGVSTFVEILISSPVLNVNYELIHLDTTRAHNDIGLENRFSLTNLLYLFRQILHLVNIYKRKKPRVMHLQITSGLSFWKATVFIVIAKTLGMKTVAHLHGGMFDYYYRRCNLLKQRIISWAFHLANVVIALSNRWQKFLIEEVRADIHIEVVSNTIDHMFAQALIQMNDEEPQKAKTILFLGSLGERKGVFDILKAVPLVCFPNPDARFVFVGGEEIKGDKIRIDRACQEHKLEEHVQFLGQVTGYKKLKLLKESMIFILPSYGENFPFALLEAMAVGLPVITTPVGAIPEVVKDGENGYLIEPGDYKSLAVRINQLLNDSDLRNAMSKTNIAQIKANYLPEVAMEKIHQIYEQLLA